MYQSYVTLHVHISMRQVLVCSVFKTRIFSWGHCPSILAQAIRFTTNILSLSFTQRKEEKGTKRRLQKYNTCVSLTICLLLTQIKYSKVIPYIFLFDSFMHYKSYRNRIACRHPLCVCWVQWGSAVVLTRYTDVMWYGSVYAVIHVNTYKYTIGRRKYSQNLSVFRSKLRGALFVHTAVLC